MAYEATRAILRTKAREARKRLAKAAILPRPKTEYRSDFRGLHRIFDEAEYRFYRSNSAPPDEDDSPFATAATLPDTPTDTFADGTWYLSMSYFNGIYDSGFLPLGDNGETYKTIVIDTGAALPEKPPAPVSAWLDPRSGGARAVSHAILAEDGETYEFAVAYTTNGSDPPEDTPDYTATATAPSPIYTRNFTSLADGVTLKIVVQIRRNDGDDETPDWVYSDPVTASLTIDADGPDGPDYMEAV